MDHLPEILDAAFPLDEVICDVKEDHLYDGPDLRQFPMRFGYYWGYDQSKYARENYRLCHDTSEMNIRSETHASFLQNWLFFGPLADIRGIVDMNFSMANFIEVRSNQRFLILRSLDEYVKQWAAIEEDQSDANKEKHKMYIYEECIILAELLAQENLLKARDPKLQHAHVPLDCALPIQILHEALKFAWGSIYGSQDLRIVTGGGLFSRFPENRMEAAGWCPSEITMLQHRFSVTSRYFASRLNRRRTVLDHRGCDKFKCYALQVDETNYVTKHVSHDCLCEHVSIDLDKVKAVLNSGKVPRFRVYEDKVDGKLYLRVVEDGPYIAISHVWAHGLGNTMANSLPACQVKRLHGYISSLSDKVDGPSHQTDIALWIDTLGVPFEKKIRKLALKALHSTYENATGVLVLDEELVNVSVKSSPEEVCLRVICCAWSRRLWTLQEGVVSWDKLWIQLQEDQYEFSNIRNFGTPIIHSPLHTECAAGILESLPRLQNVTESSVGMVISALTEACKYRTTSRLSDETFCLASLAGLPLDEILEAETHEEKMKAFLMQLKILPASIIYFQGPKLQMKGFRWAPQSFLYPGPSSTMFGDAAESQAKCSETGLELSGIGFRLDFSSFKPAQLAFCYFKLDEYWIVMTSLDLPAHQFATSVPIDEQRLSLWRQLHNLSRPALYIESLSDFANRAIVVSIARENNNVLTGETWLRVGANVVPATEVDDVFNPGRIDPLGELEIAGALIPHSTTWNLT